MSQQKKVLSNLVKEHLYYKLSIIIFFYSYIYIKVALMKNKQKTKQNKLFQEKKIIAIEDKTCMKDKLGSF